MAPNASQLSPLQGYSQLWGTKNSFIGELVGPASYPTGGMTINASQLGWGGFDEIDVGGLSYSGTYSARVQYLPVQAAPSAFNPGCNSAKVIWIVVSTGNEVANTTNLSGEIIRLTAIGV